MAAILPRPRRPPCHARGNSRARWRLPAQSGSGAELLDEEAAEAGAHLGGHLDPARLAHQAPRGAIRAEIGPTWGTVLQMSLEGLRRLGRQRLVQELREDVDGVPA